MAINKRIIRSNDEGGAGLSFNTVLYTGTGATQSITGLGFEPDLVWIKDRTIENSHIFTDVVRGENKALLPNTFDGDITSTDFFTSFDLDGFTIPPNAGTQTNKSGDNYVAWCWKAGGAAVTNTDGTTTSQVSANVAAGFSIVTYPGNGVAGSTIGHGLGVAPSVVITKGRESGLPQYFARWGVYHISLGATQGLSLSELSAAQTSVYWQNNTSPTSSVFSVGDYYNNWSGRNFVAYCFAEVAGFSKFGSYTGNLSSQTDIDCGFEPAFVMIKCSSGFNSGDWVIYDNKRPTGNPKINPLLIRPYAEQNALLFGINFTENGFNIPTTCTTNSVNQTGYTYIYMAFANQF